MSIKFSQITCAIFFSACLCSGVLSQEVAKEAVVKEAAPSVKPEQGATKVSKVKTEDKSKKIEQSTNNSKIAVGMISFGNDADPQAKALLPDYNFAHDKSKKLVSFVKPDGSAKAFMQIMDPIPYLSTTKDYAQYVMDSYSGWGLKAQISRRGFSFSYVDNSPCAATVTYFDGASYLMFGACGLIEKDDIARAFLYAKEKLNIDEHISRSALPSLYQ